ncbi:MAG: putative Ig domain-containing protein, partial [Planctomycetota bacterium]
LNNRYGLVVFNSETQGGSNPTAKMAIAVKNVDTNAPPTDVMDIPFATSSEQLWGTAQQLKLAIQSIIPNDGLEIGHLALQRVFDMNPPDIVEMNLEIGRPPTIHQQYPYQFRGNATPSIVLLSDDRVDYYNYNLQHSLTETLLGNPEIATDDIIFNAVLMTNLMGDNGENNDTTWISRSSNWTIDEDSLNFQPSTTNGTSAFAIIDSTVFDSEGFDRKFGHELPDGWVFDADLMVNDFGTNYSHTARVAFGFDGNALAMPSDYWYLEANTDTNVWTLNRSTGQQLPFSLLPNAQWPDLQTGKQFSVEVRLTPYFFLNGASTDRLDLFINGQAVASDYVNVYSAVQEPGDGFGDFIYPFVGIASSNSSLSIDSVEILQNTENARNIPPNIRTPRDFSNPDRQEVARRLFANDYGSVDGSSMDAEIIGVDFRRNAYKLENSARGYTRLNNPNTINSYLYQEAQYIDMVRAVHGSVWDLGLLRGSNNTEANRRSFSNAFSDTLANEILMRRITIESDNGMLTHVEPFFDPDNPSLATFQVTFTGTGGSDQFELDFVRQDGSQRAVIGTIPVWVTGVYSHNFEAVDEEDDRPFTFKFDPAFVDASNQIITHGAQLVDSGRPGMKSDRLTWIPPFVSIPTDFQFRVIVTDSAGQIGRKDWTVTVYPQDDNNTPPVINISGLQIDPNASNGFVGEPVLPNAKELRGYRYQVIASDADAKDAGNLKYYLEPVEQSNGTKIPVPSWLQIDRNTGLLTGRPGTTDIGPTHIKVVVSDGRFKAVQGTIVASKAEQIFLLTVDQRDHLNSPPWVNNIDDFATRVGEQVTLQVVSSDADYDALTFGLTTAPVGMSIDPLRGVINWVPSDDHVDKLHQVNVAVWDGTTTTSKSFAVFVGQRNHAPVITTELPDWVTFANYRQELTATDLDGDVIRYAVPIIHAGMTITNENNRLFLNWNKAGRDSQENIIAPGITPGRHLIRLRAFDTQGGVVDRDYYVKFADFSAPVVTDIQQPVWREGTSDTAQITIASSTQLPESAITLDPESLAMGMILLPGTATENADNTFTYTMKLDWTPRRSMTHKAILSLSGNGSTNKKEISLTVNPFVIQSENDAPVFGGEKFLGPFEKNRLTYIPLNVSDPEGQSFTLSANSNLATAQIIGHSILLKAAEGGIYHMTVTATEDSDITVTTSTNTQQSHPIAVDDNATGTGWILYSSQKLVDRIPSFTPRPGSNTNFIAVRYNAGRWEFNNDTEWIRFSTRSDDLLVAKLDFDTNTVTSLVGKSGRVNGVAFGYASGNLVFNADKWNSTSDPGEFTVVGNSFVIATAKSSQKSYTIAVLDNATPAIVYADPRQAKLCTAYQFDFEATDPNLTDTLHVSLNQAALDAGVVLVKPTDGSNKYKLTWSITSIANWASSHPLPNKLPITLDVLDNHGATSRVSFDLPVRDPAVLPIFPPYYQYRISANRLWDETPKFENAGGYKIGYDLRAVVNFDGNSIPLPAGISISTNDGRISWTPPADLLWNAEGKHVPERVFLFEVIVQLIDHPQGLTFKVPMSVEVVDPSIFNPYIPEVDTVVTPPPNAVTVDEQLQYQPVLRVVSLPEHQGVPVVWSLQSAPEGMTVDKDSGRLTWTPTGSKLGQTVPVKLRVANAQGGGTTLDFTLDVRALNVAPLMNTTFPTIWETGKPFVLDVRGFDPEGHQLSYELLSPAGGAPSESIAINKETGRINWAVPTTGNHSFLVRVFERFNPQYKLDRPLNLNVIDALVTGSHVNLEPLILGSPQGSFATAGSEFTFSFGVNDPDQPANEPFTFALVDSAPATIDANGKFRWTPPSSERGTKTFKLAVTDDSPYAGVANNTRYLTFQINSVFNAAPVLNPPGAINVNVGLEFVYKAKATDADNDALTYSLEGSIPEGMRIDPSTGEIRWLVADAMQDYDVEDLFVIAEDTYGATDKESITLEVSTADTTPPTLSYYLKDKDGKVIPPNSEILASAFLDYDLWVDIEDNRGIYLPDGNQNGSWYLAGYNTNPAPNTSPDLLKTFGYRASEYFSGGVTNPPRHGLWKIDLIGSGLNQGILEFNLEAYDQARNLVKKHVRYYVNDPTTFMTGKILNINENSPPITDRFEVVGNALELTNGIGNYDLKLTTMDDPNDFVYLAKSSPALITDSILGVVDGTVLPTGQYRLYLEVRCGASCIKAVDERIIEVQNVAKLGNLDLSFSDLNVALGGVPIP